MQEALSAHARGGAPLGREPVQGGDLRAARHGSLEGVAAPRHRRHEVPGDVVGGHDAQGDDPAALGQADPGHAASRAALRAHRGGVEAQKLGVGGDEDDLVAVSAVPGGHDRVVLLQGDDVPRALGGVGGGQALDPPVRRRQGERRGVGGEVGERQRPLAGFEGDELPQLGSARQARGRGRRRQRGCVDHLQSHDPSRRCDHADLAARGRRDRRADGVVRGARALPGRRGGVGRARHEPGRRQEGPARVVGDLQGHARLRRSVRFQEDRAARGPVGLGDLLQFAADDVAQALGRIEDAGELGDVVEELGLAPLQLDDRVLRQAAQPQLEDVLGLLLAQVEGLAEPGPRFAGVLGGPYDGDDPVDVQDGDEQPLDEVELPAGPVQAEARPPAGHVQSVLDVDAQEVQEPEGARLPFHEGHVVDPEGVLQRGVAVELEEHGLRVEPVLHLDDEPHAVVAVGQILHAGHALDLLGVDGVLELVDDLLRADEVGELGEDDALLAGRDALDVRGGAGLEGAPTRGVGLADALQPDDLAAFGQIGPGDEAHDVLEGGVRVRQEVAGAGHDFHEVVRRHVGGHAHRDAGRAVDQQVGQGGGEDLGLGERVVVVGDHVHDVLVERGRHRQGRGGQARLGVAGCRRAVVERPEVPVPVDQGDAHRERLGQAHHRVVDGDVPVRVKAPHDVADDPRGFDVAPVGAQPHLVHLEEDATLDGLEAVAGVGQGARVDHRIGVFEERGAHLGGDVDVDDVLLDRSLRGALRGWLSHANKYSRPRASPTPGPG